MKAILVRAHGGPEVLRLEEAPDPQPGPGQVMVRLEAVGVNFVDVYFRMGLYPSPTPYIPGSEGAGVVEAVGPRVTSFKRGERVAYAGVPGAYAQYAVIPAERLVKVPKGMDGKTAAAAMLQGMTAHYLTHATYPLKKGDFCLVHAAAGGVGLLICQMAKRRGAKVIGTVSTEEKARQAREAGADDVILYSKQDFEAEVKRITKNKGVQVVYDSVGKATFQKSLNCLATRGVIALFGQSSGMVPPLDLLLLRRGSLFLTRPNLADYIATREELLERATAVLNAVKTGKLKLKIGLTLPLSEASQAHHRLEGRQTTGKALLIP